MISFIVSSYQRPLKLMTCITSILAQENRQVEVIIIDNTDDPQKVGIISQFPSLDIDRVTYINTKDKIPDEMRTGCYDPSAILGVPIAKGDWLCFPNDDSYYVPGFSDLMVGAADAYAWGLVYCNTVYDPRWNGSTYQVVQGSLIPRYFTKSSFMVRKELFNGFPPHKNDWRDFALAEELNEKGVRHGCAPGVLHFSN